MREAENGQEIAAEIKKSSGIQLEIVTGKTEACRIFTSVMKWGQIKKIYVPQIGLSDGFLRLLCEKKPQKIEKGVCGHARRPRKPA